MLRNPAFATTVVTGYLALYYILFYTGASESVITAMFACSPILMVWMAITIIKYGKYTGKELREHEEWGYEDRDIPQVK